MLRSVSRRTAIAQMSGGLALAGCAVLEKKTLSASALRTASASPTVEGESVRVSEGVFDLYVGNNRPLILLSSGGHLPIPMLFDTGTSGNQIDPAVFQLFRLEKKPDHRSFISDASGTTVEAFATIVPEAKIGSVSISNATMNVYDYRAGDEAGILGPELFKGSSIYLNMSRRTVFVKKASSVPVVVADAQDYVLDNGSGLPIMPISIGNNSQKLLGLMDTGKSGALSFPEAMIDSLPLVGQPTEVGTATTVFKTVPVYGARIDAEITVGTKTIVRPDVIFHGHMPKIGMPFLDDQRIWLEPHNQRSWVASERPIGGEASEMFVGQFGERQIKRGDSGLIYQRRGSGQHRLRYFGGDHFLFDDGTDLIFRRNDLGTITGFTLLNEAGRPYEVSTALD